MLLSMTYWKNTKNLYINIVSEAKLKNGKHSIDCYNVDSWCLFMMILKIKIHTKEIGNPFNKVDVGDGLGWPIVWRYYTKNVMQEKLLYFFKTCRLLEPESVNQ